MACALVGWGACHAPLQLDARDPYSTLRIGAPLPLLQVRAILKLRLDAFSGDPFMSQSQLIEQLQRIVGPGNVVHQLTDLMVFEYDGSVDAAIESARPIAVVLPESSQQVAEIVQLARLHDMP